MLSETHDKLSAIQNVNLSKFYIFATNVMGDFGYSLSRTVTEEPEKRRVEVWIYDGLESQSALVWLEVVAPDELVDTYLSTDILRSMNEVGVTKLFLFSNTELSVDTKMVLDSEKHIIFSPTEIVETLVAIEKESKIKRVDERREVNTPSGQLLIKSYFKHNKINSPRLPLRTTAVIEIVNKYINITNALLKRIDDIEDIDSIDRTKREQLRRHQYNLLPEMIKLSNFSFPDNFAELRDILFNLVQSMIMYIGAVIEYESEASVDKYRQMVDEYISKLEVAEASVDKYTQNLNQEAERGSIRLMFVSGVIATVFLIFLFVVSIL